MTLFRTPGPSTFPGATTWPGALPEATTDSPLGTWSPFIDQRNNRNARGFDWNVGHRPPRGLSLRPGLRPR